jgi:hypothetical protein
MRMTLFEGMIDYLSEAGIEKVIHTFNPAIIFLSNEKNMIYFNTLLIAALLFIAAHAAELKPQECTIIVKSTLQISESAHDTSFECIFDYSIGANGDTTEQKTRTLPILLNNPQLKLFHNRFKNGELISSLSTLILEGIEISNSGIIIPSDKNTFDFGMIKNESSRRLRTAVTGEKRFLVVKVIDSNGEKLPQNLDQIGNDIYGPTDTMTLKSQMEACSYDKLKILPGVQSAAEIAHGNGQGNGVIQVTIDKPLNGSTNFEIRKAVSEKVEEALGITLPGPYDHVMFTLAKCYGNQCGWAAYAYVNSWLSVYQGQYYRMVGVQMHGKFGISFRDKWQLLNKIQFGLKFILAHFSIAINLSFF